MFIILSLLIIFLSYIFSILNVFAIHPGTKEKIFANNLLSNQGIQRIFTDAVKNFSEFPPLGMVLAALIGIGIAEKTGFLKEIINQLTDIVPDKLIVPMLVFTSVLSHVMGDAGIVIMPPLGAIIFIKAGRHPIAGICAAFFGCVGGFNANIILTPLDPLLSGFTHSASQIIDKNYNVYATANYYFLAVSHFLVTAVGTWVTVKIIEPRLGKFTKEDIVENEAKSNINNKKSLIISEIVLLLLIILFMFMIIPSNGILRDSSGGLTPFYKSIITIIIIIFFIPGTLYGILYHFLFVIGQIIAIA